MEGKIARLTIYAGNIHLQSRQKQRLRSISGTQALFINRFSLHIILIKRIAALRAEAGCLGGIGRLPAALIALIHRRTGGTLCAAFCAELTLVHSAAGAGPAILGGLFGAALGAELTGSESTAGRALPAIRRLGFGLLAAAFRAELACGGGSAGTLPAICICCRLGRLSRLSRRLLLAHLEQLSSVHSTAHCGHIHAHKSVHRAALNSWRRPASPAPARRPCVLQPYWYCGIRHCAGVP